MQARVAVPDRDAMVASLAQTNRWHRPLVGAWWAMLVFGVVTLRWGDVVARPAQAVVALGMAAGPFLASMAVMVLGNHKAIEDLDPSVRFGPYGRDELIALVDDVCRRLDVPKPASVRVSRDTSLNASAIQVGFSWLFPSLNAVYLHRQMLHVLSPGELSSVIGHELSHLYRHKVHFRFDSVLHVAVGAVVALHTMVALGDMGGLELGGVLFATWAYQFVLGRVIGDHDEDIEFLCDDVGAQAAGVIPAINTELKLAVDMETTTRLQRMLTEAHQDVPMGQLLRAYEEAVPFGKMDEAELKRTVAGAVRDSRQGSGELSVSGYIAFVMGTSEGGDLDPGPQEMPEVLKPVDAPLLTWDRSALASGEGLDEAAIAALCAQMEAKPDHLVVDVYWEQGLRYGGVHPNVTRRVLYLWKNRAAIEADARRTIAASQT